MAAQAFGLTISLKKTEVLHQKSPHSVYNPPQITIGSHPLNTVEHFTYLGSVISNDASITKDVDNRLAKANSSFGRLQHRVWQNQSLRMMTKVRVYVAVVISTLLYAAESWTMYRKHTQLLERFHQRCLRSIMRVRWQDYVTNVEVLERAGLPSIEAMLLQRHLRWAGHVSRMGDTRMPKAVFFGELSKGKRDRGAPRRRYKDQLKKQLAQAGIDHRDWQKLASDRGEWRSVTKRTAKQFEDARVNNAKEKRKRRKESVSQAATYDGQTFPCPSCPRMCRSKIGLFSHQRACIPRQ